MPARPNRPPMMISVPKDCSKKNNTPHTATMKDDQEKTTEDIQHRDNDGNNVRASWNFSVDNIRANTAHFAPEETELLIALFRWCTDPRHPIRREEAARRIGCSSALLYQLLAGIYRNPDKTLKRPSSTLHLYTLRFL